MDTDTLVTELKEESRKLVEELPQRGFEVSAAFWIKTSVDEKWHFYIVSPMVDNQGLREAYGALRRAMPPLFWIGPLGITLIGPSDPMAPDILAFQRRKAVTRITPAHWGGTWLGNMSIQDDYVYLLPVGTLQPTGE